MHIEGVEINVERASKIQGWMTRGELCWLATVGSRSNVVVEVGSYKGRSTRALADYCPGVVYAVDPWSGLYYRSNGNVDKAFDTRQSEEFRRNLQDHIQSGKVVPVASRFEDALGELPKEVDLLFIDGDHRYEAVVRDIFNSLTLMRRGGILAGHDYGKSSWPGVKKAVDEAFGKRVELYESIWSVRV